MLQVSYISISLLGVIHLELYSKNRYYVSANLNEGLYLSSHPLPTLSQISRLRAFSATSQILLLLLL